MSISILSLCTILKIFAKTPENDILVELYHKTRLYINPVYKQKLAGFFDPTRWPPEKPHIGKLEGNSRDRRRRALHTICNASNYCGNLHEAHSLPENYNMLSSEPADHSCNGSYKYHFPQHPNTASANIIRLVSFSTNRNNDRILGSNNLTEKVLLCSGRECSR